jgi:hypothetical protein
VSIVNLTVMGVNTSNSSFLQEIGALGTQVYQMTAAKEQAPGEDIFEKIVDPSPSALRTAPHDSRLYRAGHKPSLVCPSVLGYRTFLLVGWV